MAVKPAAFAGPNASYTRTAPERVGLHHAWISKHAHVGLGRFAGNQVVQVIQLAADVGPVANLVGVLAVAAGKRQLEDAALDQRGPLFVALGADVVAAIAARTGVRIEVISGEDEGRLAYLGARSGLGAFEGSLVVFDTGGGSSQFTFGSGSRVDERFSVEVGAVKYTERFHLDQVVSPESLRDAIAAISADLARLDGRPSPDQLVAMGGVVTNITAVKHRLARYDPTVVQGTVLDRAEIERQIELYRSQDATSRRTIVGLQPKREEVILAGACIVRTVMEKLGKETLTVSDRGLRHGVLAERFGN